MAIVPEQQEEGVISALENQLLSFGKVNLIVYPMERLVRELQNKTFFLPTIYRHAILLFEQQKGCFRGVLDTVCQQSKQSPVANKYLPDPESINSLHPLFSYAFYPHCLTEEETSDPFIVLYNFFQMAHLPTVKKEISAWMETVNNGLNGRRHEASTLLTFYEGLNKLIHAAFLIRKMDHNNRPANLPGILSTQYVNLALSAFDNALTNSSLYSFVSGENLSKIEFVYNLQHARQRVAVRSFVKIRLISR